MALVNGERRSLRIVCDGASPDQHPVVVLEKPSMIRSDGEPGWSVSGSASQHGRRFLVGDQEVSDLDVFGSILQPPTLHPQERRASHHLRCGRCNLDVAVRDERLRDLLARSANAGHWELTLRLLQALSSG